MNLPNIMRQDVKDLAEWMIALGFVYNGPQARNLLFAWKDGQTITLPTRPGNWFSAQIHRNRCLKICGQASKDRYHRKPQPRSDTTKSAADEFAAAAAQHAAQQRREQLRKAVDKRRGELIAIQHLMGAGQPRCF